MPSGRVWVAGIAAFEAAKKIDKQCEFWLQHLQGSPAGKEGFGLEIGSQTWISRHKLATLILQNANGGICWLNDTEDGDHKTKNNSSSSSSSSSSSHHHHPAATTTTTKTEEEEEEEEEQEEEERQIQEEEEEEHQPQPQP